MDKIRDVCKKHISEPVSWNIFYSELPTTDKYISPKLLRLTFFFKVKPYLLYVVITNINIKLSKTPIISAVIVVGKGSLRIYSIYSVVICILLKYQKPIYNHINRCKSFRKQRFHLQLRRIFALSYYVCNYNITRCLCVTLNVLRVCRWIYSFRKRSYLIQLYYILIFYLSELYLPNTLTILILLKMFTERRFVPYLVRTSPIFGNWRAKHDFSS